MKYTLTQLYFAFCYLETGNYLNNFIIKRDLQNKKLRFGPLLISPSEDIIQKNIEKMNKNKEYSLNQEEKEYLAKIVKIENIKVNSDKSHLVHFKSLFISLKLIEYQMFKSSNIQRLIYKNIGIKLFSFLYEKKFKKNLEKLSNYWFENKISFRYNIKWCCSNCEEKNKKKCFYHKISNFLSHPHLSTIVNIHDTVQKYDYKINLIDHNILYKETENIKLCAYYIRILTKQWVTSAWHCHNIFKHNILYSAFDENFEKYKKNMFRYLIT